MKLALEPKAVIAPGVQVSCARFSPCGKFLLAPGFDSAVHRWDVTGDQPAPLASVNGHHAWATDIAFHPDGGLAVSSDSWGQLRAWDYAAESPEPRWVVAEAHDGWIRSIAMSPDGQTLATCGRDRQVKLFATETGRPIREFGTQDEDVFGVAFHPSGQWLVSGDLKGNVVQWECATGNKIRRFEAPDLYLYSYIQDVGGVRRFAFSPDGRSLAVAGAKPASGGFVKGSALVYLFDFESGETLDKMVLGKPDADVFAHDLFFHPSGAIVAATSGQPGQGSLIVHRPGEPESELVYNKGLTNCHSVCLHPDGQSIALSSTNSGSNGNGRRLVDGEYQGNHSPIHLFTLSEG
ncbi:hypothetical protein BH23VER1_BH23VER1_00340 [soil metagenome]